MSSPSKIKTQIEPGSKTGTKITDESDIKDINDALTKATPADVDLLLGDGENKGLLEIAMNKATEQIQTDYKTCSQVSSLAYLLLTKLGDNSKDLGQEKETKIDSLITKYTSLDLLVQKYANPTPADSKATLDDILNKKELGKKEFSELFEQNIAREISKEYKSDPTNPMNAVKILVVEGLRRKFETIANTSTVSTDLSSKIITNDYFKSDSKTYQDWKLITEQTEGTELKPKTEDEKRLIDDYETKIRSISDFKINE